VDEGEVGERAAVGEIDAAQAGGIDRAAGAPAVVDDRSDAAAGRAALFEQEHARPGVGRVGDVDQHAGGRVGLVDDELAEAADDGGVALRADGLAAVGGSVNDLLVRI